MYGSFFTGLRRVLIANSKVSLGAVAKDVIENLILPQIDEMLDNESLSEKQRDNLEENKEIWLQYANLNGAGAVFNKAGISSVYSAAMKYNIRDPRSIEELANDVAGVFYSSYSEGIPAKFRHFKDKADFIAQGPESFIKFFRNAVKQSAGDILIKQHLHSDKLRSMNAPLGEDGGEVGDLIGDNSVSDDNEIMEVKNDMRGWIMRKISGDEHAKTLFEIWMELADDQGSPDVNWSKEVFPIFYKKTGMSSGKMNILKKELLGLMVRYFREVQKTPLSPRVLKNLKVASVVASNFIRIKLATWMIAPLG